MKAGAATTARPRWYALRLVLFVLGMVLMVPLGLIIIVASAAQRSR